MKSRIKELRLSRHLTQRELGDIISVTQQNISKYENNVIEVPVDVLIKIAQYFNVTTDYILGITETKRNLERQVIVNKAIDEYFEYVEIFKSKRQIMRQSLNSTPPVMGGAASGICPEDYLTMA